MVVWVPALGVMVFVCYVRIAVPRNLCFWC